MTEFFMRKNDPLMTVYEVDFDAGKWRLVASALGKFDVGGSLSDDGCMDFEGARFVRVWKLEEDGDTLVFTELPPERRH